MIGLVAVLAIVGVSCLAIVKRPTFNLSDLGPCIECSEWDGQPRLQQRRAAVVQRLDYSQLDAALNDPRYEAKPVPDSWYGWRKGRAKLEILRGDAVKWRAVGEKTWA